MKVPWTMRASVVIAGIAIAVQAVMAVDVKVQVEKTFDFKAVKTWAWNPEGPGDVKMVRSDDDDPEAMRKRAEPVIMKAVLDEMDRRGWRLTRDAPDLSLTYFLLLSTSVTSQTVGQFLPATAMWGLPPFAPATQSLEYMNQGSLVLDLKSKQNFVWRGVAEAKIKVGEEAKRREERLRDAVKDLVRRVPKK